MQKLPDRSFRFAESLLVRAHNRTMSARSGISDRSRPAETAPIAKPQLTYPATALKSPRPAGVVTLHAIPPKGHTYSGFAVDRPPLHISFHCETVKATLSCFGIRTYGISTHVATAAAKHSSREDASNHFDFSRLQTLPTQNP